MIQNINWTNNFAGENHQNNLDPNNFEDENHHNNLDLNNFEDETHTPSTTFWHLPPNSARFSYATEGALFISAQTVEAT